MVKGISKQVIVVHSPDPKLFEEAIFILKDEALKHGVTEDALLKEAQQLMRNPEKGRSKHSLALYGPAWACGGALVTGLAWLITLLC